MGDAEISLGHFDAAIDEYRKALDFGLASVFCPHEPRRRLRACGQDGRGEARLAEARRLNPAITVKWMKEHTPNLPAVFDGLSKAGLAEE